MKLSNFSKNPTFMNAVCDLLKVFKRLTNVSYSCILIVDVIAI